MSTYMGARGRLGGISKNTMAFLNNKKYLYKEKMSKVVLYIYYNENNNSTIKSEKISLGKRIKQLFFAKPPEPIPAISRGTITENERNNKEIKNKERKKENESSYSYGSKRWCDLEPGASTELKVEEGTVEITCLLKCAEDGKRRYRCTYNFGAPSFCYPGCELADRLSVYDDKKGSFELIKSQDSLSQRKSSSIHTKSSDKSANKSIMKKESKNKLSDSPKEGKAKKKEKEKEKRKKKQVLYLS